MFAMLIPFLGLVIADLAMEGLMKRDDLSIGVESLIFIIYSVITFYYILQDMEFPNLVSTAQFWIISGVLIYFGGNIFVFISSNYMLQLSVEASTLLWGIHALICLVYYSLFTVGLWKTKESRS